MEIIYQMDELIKYFLYTFFGCILEAVWLFSMMFGYWESPLIVLQGILQLPQILHSFFALPSLFLLLMMCCPMWQCGKKCGMWLEPLVYVSTVCVCMWPHIACCQLLNWQHTLVHCVLECVLACGISRVKCLRVWHACEDFFLAPFRDYRMTLKCNHNRSSKLSLSIYVSISLRVSSMSVKINCFIWSALNWAFWPQMLMLKQYAQGLRNILLFIQCNQNNKESQIFYILPRIPRIFLSKILFHGGTH